MNADTKRTLQQIKEQGYFHPWTTLGEGGWQEALPIIRGWQTFELYHVHKKEVLDTIITSNEAQARKIFADRWDLHTDVHVIRLASRKQQIYTGA